MRMNLTSPYSSLYDTDFFSPGSLPFFLIGVNGTFSCKARIGPNRNPRDSRAATHSTAGDMLLARVTRVLHNNSNMSGFCNTENISL